MRRLAMAFLSLALLSAVACSKSTDPQPRPFVYPLAVGNEWVYEITEILEYRHADVDTNVLALTTVTVTDVDTAIAPMPGYRVIATQASGDPPGRASVSERVYQNRDDGLYLLADCGTVPEYPKRTAARDLRALTFVPGFSLRQLSRLGGSPDSGGCGPLIWRNPPVLTLAYPLEIGRSWLYTDGYFGAIDRVITGYKRVRTDAGSFDCFEIEWRYEELESVEVTDYVADDGLIRRRVFRADMVITTYENPFGGDTADVTWLTDLQSVSLVGEGD